MNAPPRHPVRATALAAALLLVVQFSLACGLAPFQTGADPDASVLDRWLGGARTLLAREATERADLYLHRGAEPVDRAAAATLFGRWRNQLVPAGHVHAKASSAREILPWMTLAARLDPSDPDTALNLAYWLRVAGAGGHDLDAFFREASARNPGAYVLPMEWARFELSRENWDRARRKLELALALWPAPLGRDDRQAQEDRSLMLQIRASLRVIGGDRAGALADLREALPITLRAPLLQGRLHALESGAETPAIALAALRAAFGPGAAPAPIACGREHEDDHDHEHDHAHD